MCGVRVCVYVWCVVVVCVFGLFMCLVCVYCVCGVCVCGIEILLIRTFLKFQNLNIFQSGVGPRKGAANIKTLKIKD